MSFVSSNLLDNLGRDRELADDEGCGVVQVDDAGTILLFNKYESEMTGIDSSFAEGRNFFTQVAPCANNRLFFGRFKDGVAKGALDERFKYTFTYKMRPTPVDVHLYRDEASATNWLFLKRAA